jgi:hypothetical protein
MKDRKRGTVPIGLYPSRQRGKHHRAPATRPTTGTPNQTTRSNGPFGRRVLIFLPMTDRQQGADGYRCEQEG